MVVRRKAPADARCSGLGHGLCGNANVYGVHTYVTRSQWLIYADVNVYTTTTSAQLVTRSHQHTQAIRGVAQARGKKHGEKTTNRINKPIVNVYGVHTYAYARALYRVGMAQAPQTAYISHSWRKFVTSLTFFAKLLDIEIPWLYNGTMFDEYRRNKNFYEKLLDNHLHVLYNGTSIAANLFEAL